MPEEKEPFFGPILDRYARLCSEGKFKVGDWILLYNDGRSYQVFPTEAMADAYAITCPSTFNTPVFITPYRPCEQ